MNVQITRWVTHVVERCAECGISLSLPHRQVVAAVVLRARDADEASELDALYAAGAELGRLLTERALLAIGCPPSNIEAYGKAALAGTNIPLEWGAALLHPRLGKAVRECLPGASSIMPSVTKRGAAGACVDVPLHHVTNMWSFDHFDTISLCVPDAPASDELLIAIALAERGRPLARVRPD